MRARQIPYSTPADGARLAWAIDAAAGNDSFIGSPAKPLRTMRAFNSRQAGLGVSVAQTLQCVGNVTDEPLMLSGTRYITGASLTVSGTRTSLATGCTISVVTALGGNPIGSSFPWQLTTSGVNWSTTPVGAQIRFSNGALGYIAEVVDASNVVVSPATTAGATSVPTTALTFSVETLSQALPPIINGVSAVAGGIDTVVLQDLQLPNGKLVVNGINVALKDCEILVTASPTWEMTSQLRWVRCRLTNATAGILRIRSAPQAWTALGCTYVGAAGASPSIIVQGGQALMQVSTMLNCRLFGLDACFLQVGSGMHFRNTVATGSSGLITLSAAARMYVLNNVNGSINGLIGNSGVMFDVRNGEFIHSATSSRPTAKGTVDSEVRLGNVQTLSYAAIGTGRRLAALDAIPPTSVELVLPGYSAWGVTA